MPIPPEIHKLSAILKADVQNYSRLMGEDEAHTLHTLFQQRATFAERIEEHGGRVVNTTGDSILAELPSVVDAVQCAVDIQDRLSYANAVRTGAFCRYAPERAQEWHV